MRMSKQVQERIQEHQAIKAHYEQNLKDLERLNERYDSLAEQLSGIAGEIEQATKAKDQAYDAFVTGRLKEADLNKAKQALAGIQSKQTDLQDLIDATERAIQRIEAENASGFGGGNLSRRVYDAERAIWLAIYQDIKTQIPEQFTLFMHQIITAKNKSGISVSDSELMEQLFGSAYAIPEDSIRKQLLEGYMA